MNLRHYYDNNANGLSVFLNGYKQYANMEKGDSKNIILPQPIGIDNIMKYFNDNPEEYEKWKQRTGKSEKLNVKKQHDIIIFFIGRRIRIYH